MTVFEYKRPLSDTKLSEYFSDFEFYFELVRGESKQKISLYSLNDGEGEKYEPYLGYSLCEVLNSGRDILGEKLLSGGDPEYSAVKTALPKITKKAYAFLGGPASWAGVTVEPDGSIIHQLSGRDREPKPIFTPVTVDAELGKIPPRMLLSGGEYPVLVSIHTDGVRTLELLYFVEPGDTDRDPIVWIRSKKYLNTSAEDHEIKYAVSAISREGDEFVHNENPPTEKIFLEALCDTLCYWTDFSGAQAKITIPEEEIARVARGAVSFSALTFTGAHPHYGHKFYGKELHDNFPPNYLWAIEASCLLGRWEWAKEIFDGMIAYGLNDDGKMCYRQGLSLNLGVSATEYGMLIFLANKYKKILGINAKSEKALKKICGMGNQILAHCVPCPEFSNRILVKMCAEADTNERVNVYLNNNLWAIRGFTSLCELLSDTGKDFSVYENMVKTLSENIMDMLSEYTECDTRFGKLAPFRFGYTATPLTLSSCRDTFYPIPDAELDSYLNSTRTRGPESSKQDFTENTYSNYRYYPEALCSMLVPDELADNIVKMRESLGGELVGMTRFRSWIDNWPVLNYARFLIESGRIEKYLLLLYAHTAHHGRADLMAYYEQISADGEVRANDCVPSLLTNPIMLAWAFAYERVSDGRLMLLSALPKSWYSKPFSAVGLGYSEGLVDLVSDGVCVDISFSEPTEKEVSLVWRAKEKISPSDIEVGKEYVSEICGNTVLFKKGIKFIKIKIK